MSITAKHIALACAMLSLPACEPADKKRSYWEHPQDAEVTAYVFDHCLKRSVGPKVVHYNDQDESIAECGKQADDMARYCPTGATDCLPQYQRTREDVRMILKGRP